MGRSSNCGTVWREACGRGHLGPGARDRSALAAGGTARPGASACL